MSRSNERWLSWARKGVRCRLITKGACMNDTFHVVCTHTQKTYGLLVDHSCLHKLAKKWIIGVPVPGTTMVVCSRMWNHCNLIYAIEYPRYTWIYLILVHTRYEVLIHTSQFSYWRYWAEQELWRVSRVSSSVNLSNERSWSVHHAYRKEEENPSQMHRHDWR